MAYTYNITYMVGEMGLDVDPVMAPVSLAPWQPPHDSPTAPQPHVNSHFVYI